MTQNHLTEATQSAPPPPKWLQCNGQQLKKLSHAALAWLDQHHQHVNALNVFPVPDGDTGTNMLLTMRSAYGRIQDSEETHVGKLAEQLAHGALMGARGNSGVILSQIWRGLAKGLKGKETFDAQDLANAFQAASDTAYGGVMKPVEGTILTIIREGASEAADAAKKKADDATKAIAAATKAAADAKAKFEKAKNPPPAKKKADKKDKKKDAKKDKKKKK